MNRGGFSWKRFMGISRTKSRISRSIGIPFTRSGRQRKIGRIVTGGGCMVVILMGIGIPTAVMVAVYKIFWT